METLTKNLSDVNIGVDIENIDRFKTLNLTKDTNFLKKVFTKKELEYCFSKTNPAQHLAARFAGKEAVIKALKTHNKPIRYNEIEIINRKKVPLVRIKNTKNIKAKISLSHCKEKAIAFAIAMKEI